MALLAWKACHLQRKFRNISFPLLHWFRRIASELCSEVKHIIFNQWCPMNISSHSTDVIYQPCSVCGNKYYPCAVYTSDVARDGFTQSRPAISNFIHILKEQCADELHSCGIWLESQPRERGGPLWLLAVRDDILQQTEFTAFPVLVMLFRYLLLHFLQGEGTPRKLATAT
jgi:hypothetical protein